MPLCAKWMDTIANVRIHGETRRKPVKLFAFHSPELRYNSPLCGNLIGWPLKGTDVV